MCDADRHLKVDRCSCGCDCGTINRRFFSREERIAKLEGYLKELQAETDAVEAKLRCIKEEK